MCKGLKYSTQWLLYFKLLQTPRYLIIKMCVSFYFCCVLVIFLCKYHTQNILRIPRALLNPIHHNLNNLCGRHICYMPIKFRFLLVLRTKVFYILSRKIAIHLRLAQPLIFPRPLSENIYIPDTSVSLCVPMRPAFLPRC